MRIIGLSGFARTGKDEVAKILVRDHGFTQLAFADKLRDFLYAENPIVVISEPHHCSESLREGWVPWPGTIIYLQDIIDRVGWDGYKETKVGPEIRRLLQRLGTEAGRQVLGENVWVDATLNNLPDGDYVVSDARFFNEFDAIRERGGHIIRINRPGVGPLNEHASEMEAVGYRHFAKQINNDGTLRDLADNVRYALNQLGFDYYNPDATPSGVITYNMTRGE